MMQFPSSCLSRQGYTATRDPSFDRLQSLKGRPRFRPMNLAPSYRVDLTLPLLDAGQYSQWVSFWAGLKGGTDWFLMDLYVDDVLRECACHATGPYSSTHSTDWRWDVSVSLEAIPT